LSPTTTDADSLPTPDDRDGPAEKSREPLLVETVVAVEAPALSICARDGQIRPLGADGYRSAHGQYRNDRRILSRAELTVNGAIPEYLGHRLIGASASKHVSVVRTPLDPTPDPVLVVERQHRAGLGESITIRNHGRVPREVRVCLRVAADFADISAVRRGQPGDSAPVEECTGGGVVRWPGKDDDAPVTLTASVPPERVAVERGSTAVLHWRRELARDEHWTIEIRLSAQERPRSGARVELRRAEGGLATKPLEPLGDQHLDALVAQGLADLDALLLCPAERPAEIFLAAGAPWYLTLFGRDSLWASRLLLGVDTDCRLAVGTLRVLASTQGENHVADSDEQPGKILHELRLRTTYHQQGEVLPPLYYGSMDATPLFVILLTEVAARQPHLAQDEQLMDAAGRAVDWMRKRAAEPGAGGFVRYATTRPGSLFNHGWKDSSDAIVGLDGVNAHGPIALAEVQAYAYQAAVGFSGLLSACGRVGEAQELGAWAEGLKRRFLKSFLREDPRTGRRYFVIALDGHDRPVFGLTSNMGHLLGTGIVEAKQAAQIARHLESKELNSGWGLRTRGSGHPSFSPFSYHGGAVWAHDTAIAVRGLALSALEAHKDGDRASVEACVSAARTLADGLIAAGAAFGYRLPELFSGGPREESDKAPLPFPAACRPQAWSSAAAVALHESLRAIRDL